MAKSYLLDTNTISLLVSGRGDNALVAIQNLKKLGDAPVYISAIVAGEIEYGLHKKQSQKLRHHVNEFLSVYKIVSFDEACANNYGAIRSKLESVGHPIAPNNLLVLVHAYSLNAVIISNDEALIRAANILNIKSESWRKAD